MTIKGAKLQQKRQTNKGSSGTDALEIMARQWFLKIVITITCFLIFSVKVSSVYSPGAVLILDTPYLLLTATRSPFCLQVFCTFYRLA